MSKTALVEGVRVCLQAEPAIPNFPNEAFGPDVQPPYVIWAILNLAGDLNTESYRVPQGGDALYLRTHSWAANHTAAWELHDVVADRFAVVPIVPTGRQPLHRPRLMSADSVPDKTTKHYQVVGTWYFRWTE